MKTNCIFDCTNSDYSLGAHKYRYSTDTHLLFEKTNTQTKHATTSWENTSVSFYPFTAFSLLSSYTTLLITTGHLHLPACIPTALASQVGLGLPLRLCLYEGSKSVNDSRIYSLFILCVYAWVEMHRIVSEIPHFPAWGEKSARPQSWSVNWLESWAERRGGLTSISSPLCTEPWHSPSHMHV